MEQDIFLYGEKTIDEQPPPKCKHKNITREDGCDECEDCGVRNF
jgi:hypothetical protein